MNLSSIQSSAAQPLPFEEVRKAIEIKNPRAEKAAKGFETMLAKSMMEEFKNSIARMSDTTGSDVFADIFTQGVAEQISDKGELGISKEIYAEIQKIENRQRHQNEVTP